MSYQIIFTDELYHHGVKGQKWGVRHYQNTDGSYKSGAQGRYNDDGSPGVNKNRSNSGSKSSGSTKSSKVKAGNKKDAKDAKKGPRKKMSTKKKVAIGAAVIGGTALAAYGAHKYKNYVKDKAANHMLSRGEKMSNDIMKNLRYLDRRDVDTKEHYSKAALEAYTTHLEGSKQLRSGSYSEARKYLKSQGVSARPRLRR